MDLKGCCAYSRRERPRAKGGTTHTPQARQAEGRRLRPACPSAGHRASRPTPAGQQQPAKTALPSPRRGPAEGAETDPGTGSEAERGSRQTRLGGSRRQLRPPARVRRTRTRLAAVLEACLVAGHFKPGTWVAGVPMSSLGAWRLNWINWGGCACRALLLQGADAVFTMSAARCQELAVFPTARRQDGQVLCLGVWKRRRAAISEQNVGLWACVWGWRAGQRFASQSTSRLGSCSCWRKWGKSTQSPVDSGGGAQAHS